MQLDSKSILRAPLTAAAEDKFCDIFLENKTLTLHVNHLPADDSHEILCLNWFHKESIKF